MDKKLLHDLVQSIETRKQTEQRLRATMSVLLTRSENQILVLETLLKRLVQVCVHTQDKRLAKELKLMDFTRLAKRISDDHTQMRQMLQYEEGGLVNAQSPAETHLLEAATAGSLGLGTASGGNGNGAGTATGGASPAGAAPNGGGAGAPQGGLEGYPMQLDDPAMAGGGPYSHNNNAVNLSGVRASQTGLPPSGGSAAMPGSHGALPPQQQPPPPQPQHMHGTPPGGSAASLLQGVPGGGGGGNSTPPQNSGGVPPAPGQQASAPNTPHSGPGAVPGGAAADAMRRNSSAAMLAGGNGGPGVGVPNGGRMWDGNGGPGGGPGGDGGMAQLGSMHGVLNVNSTQQAQGNGNMMMGGARQQYGGAPPQHRPQQLPHMARAGSASGGMPHPGAPQPGGRNPMRGFDGMDQGHFYQ